MVRELSARRALVEGGYRWWVEPWAEGQGLEAVWDSFPNVARLSGSRVLKSNEFRTVVQVPRSSDRARETGAVPVPLCAASTASAKDDRAAEDRLGPTGWLVKAYRYTACWDRFRYRWVRHRALQEFVALRRLRALGFPVPLTLAVAERREGWSPSAAGLVTEFLEGTTTLAQALRALRPQVRPPWASVSERSDAGSSSPALAALRADAGDLVASAGWLTRRLHDHGVWHRDLHAENFLVAADGRSLHLVDVHTCLFLPRLARWQRFRGVVQLAHSLRVLVPARDLRRLIEAYGPEALSGAASLDAAAERILRGVEWRERDRIRSRSKRCFLPSSRYGVKRGAGRRLFYLREMQGEALETAIDEEAGRFRRESKDRGRSSPLVLGKRRLVLEHRAYAFIEGLLATFVPHALRRRYAGAHGLWVRGIACPLAIALAESRRLGLVRESHLVTELPAEAAVPLDRFLLDRYWGKPAMSGNPASLKHALARAVGGLLRTLHEAGLRYRDLRPGDLLVEERRTSGSEDRSPGTQAPCEVRLIVARSDYRAGRRVPLSRAARVRDLARMAAYPEGHVSAADLRRGLAAYAAEDVWWLSPLAWARIRARVLVSHLRSLQEPAAKHAPGPAVAPG